jgi:hypothetical protein
VVEALADSPLAGPFDAAMLQLLESATGDFPFAERPASGKRGWTIATAHGAIEIWFTSDGGIFIAGQTTLNLVYPLFTHLLKVCPDLALEDCLTHELHNHISLMRQMRLENQTKAGAGNPSPRTDSTVDRARFEPA